MIRVCTMGDPHLTEGRRWGETYACLHYVVEDGIAEGAQLWLVTGDLVGHTVPYRSTIAERNALAGLFTRMASVGPVVIVQGNHDTAGDHQLYARLAAPHRIYVCEDPCTIPLDALRAMVDVLPYPSKRWWGQGASIAEGAARATATLRGQIEQWGREVAARRAAGITTIGLAHCATDGSALAGGEVMRPGQELMLGVDDLETWGCDFIALGHIHLRQQLTRFAWHVGTASRSTFGEVDEKGHLLVDVDAGRPPIVHVRRTPARAFVTVDAEWVERDGTWGWSADTSQVPADAEVRIRTTIPEEHLGTADPETLAVAARAAGAHAVAIERRTVPRHALRCEAITTARTEEEQLTAYWSSRADAPDLEQQARCRAKLAELLEAA